MIRLDRFLRALSDALWLGDPLDVVRHDFDLAIDFYLNDRDSPWEYVSQEIVDAVTVPGCDIRSRYVLIVTREGHGIVEIASGNVAEHLVEDATTDRRDPILVDLNQIPSRKPAHA